MLKLRSRMVKRLRWGVSGLGHFSETGFIPTLQLLAKSKLVSVYSSDIERARFIADKFAASNHYSDYDEFLKSDIDCVYVSSANVNHHWQVIKAAEAGKHVLVEKPMAMTSAEAEEMVNVCKANNVLLSVNYVYRFHPLILKAKEIIRKGMIGQIVSISANFNCDYAPNENFRFKKMQSGGGALRDIGTHMIDLLLFLGGNATEINGVMDNIIYSGEVEDFAAAVMKFKDGGYGLFNVSFNSKKAFNRFEIIGYDGSILIENLIGKKMHFAKLIIDLNGEKRKAFRKRSNKQVALLRSVQKSFLKNTPPVITGSDGLENLRLMEELEGKCHR
jgi:predicted dehydrogenase